MKCEGEKVYDNPGKCPVCKMNLEAVHVLTRSQGMDRSVKVAGAMKDVMHKGELFGRIDLDTISNKKNLYGLGPVDYLKGEILVKDGSALVSRVSSDGQIVIENSFKVKSPVFVYGNVDKWDEMALPDSVQSLPQLNLFLNDATKDHLRPFVFRVTADIDSSEIHVVNLPDGREVRSPEDAHEGLVSFELRNEKVELIGFFSTEHQGVFTHHDTFVHIHLITADGKKMGHLDKLAMKKSTAKLYLPAK
jgi:acetolactate decarboxylase